MQHGGDTAGASPFEMHHGLNSYRHVAGRHAEERTASTSGDKMVTVDLRLAELGGVHLSKHAERMWQRG